MSNLKKYRFCDLYTMSSGISSTKDQAGHGSPFLSFSVVFNNYFVPDALFDLMATSDKEKETYSIKSGDIFLTRTSEVVDELAMSCVAIKDYPKASYSGFLKRLRPTQTDITYSKFMAFYLRSPMFRKTMTNNAVMTLRASLNEAIFSYLDLLLPKYDDQVKAGDLLYLLNEKIELNNRINAELEAMAKTLYDYWFVQFDFPDDSPQGQGKPYKSSGGKMVFNPTLKREIPEGWEDSTIGDIEPNIVTGKTPSKDNPEYFGGNVPFITIGDIRGNTYVVFTEETLTEQGASTQKNKFLPEDSICVTCIASPGLVGFVTIPAQTNQQINSVVCSNEINKYYLYFAIKGYFEGAKAKTGNTFSNMNKGDFSAIGILKPSDQVLHDYHQKAHPLFEQIKLKSLENQQLVKLRAWLLPMLMNGQVAVK